MMIGNQLETNWKFFEIKLLLEKEWMVVVAITNHRKTEQDIAVNPKVSPYPRMTMWSTPVVPTFMK